MSSTNFSDNEILPSKLKYKRALKAAESATPSNGTSSVTKKSPKSTIDDDLKGKGALTIKQKEERKRPSSAPIMHKGESSKTGAKRGTHKSTKFKVAESDDIENTDWTNDVPFCPTYYPSREEFEDPVAYLQKISLQASEYGICKIVSPLSPSVLPSEVLKKATKGEEFQAEYLPMQAGYREDAYLTKRFYNVATFEKMADEQYAKRYKSAMQFPSTVVEKDFWTKVAQKNGELVEYVNGLNKSAFSSDLNDPLGKSGWNLKNFIRLPQSPVRLLEHNIPGVTDPLLYLGMLFSYVFWSAEPGHLYSIEYHHFGAPRTWYGSPGSASFDFEKVVKEVVFPEENLQAYEAYDLLNFKTMLFSPNIMLKHNIPLFKTVQYPGEFVITFPKAYHMGINHGFNCWEAASFATPHWYPFGDESSERRALYDRPQIVPYQELLCIEAMDMFLNKKSNLESHSYRDMKINFACLIKLHHIACQEIKRKGGGHLRIAPHSNKIIFCGICQRECHLAYVSCKCFRKPICIFHEIYKECTCKTPRFISVTEEILDLQTIAKSFENEDDGLWREVEKLVKIRGEIMGCTLSMDLDSKLDELISLEAKLRKMSPPVTKKPRRNR